MLHDFPFFLLIVFIIVLLIILANKLKIAYPILLVLGGLLISFIPGVPVIKVDPELIFIIFLPPLLYEAAWAISWKELWRWRRIISSFAFVVVFLTAMAVAFVANAFIPGFSLALGFLLGGIVSPPDAVSAGAILKFVKLPKRISSILEGESLLNDASSLIIFRFAALAVTTGQFIWYNAALSFVWMVIGGAGIGILIGWVFKQLHERLPIDANINVLLTLLAPYTMYIAAEEVHASGVLAVVCGGLYLSYRRNIIFGKAGFRLKGVNVWESLVFVLNGLVFMLIGLELPVVVEGIKNEGISIGSAIWYGVLITTVLMIGRLLAAYGAVVTTLVMRNFIKVGDASNPGIKGPFIIGWTGMRGVVSLAAALSIPTVMKSGAPFPHRDLILFITFIVILLTLVVNGLTLPYFIRTFNLPDPDHTLSEDEIYDKLGKQMAHHGLQHLKTNYSEELKTHPALQQLARRIEADEKMYDDLEMSDVCKTVYSSMINAQREWLDKKNKEEELLNEDIVRRHFYQLDLEESRMEEA